MGNADFGFLDVVLCLGDVELGNGAAFETALVALQVPLRCDLFDPRLVQRFARG